MSISLPLATESVRCVDFAMNNAVDPGGTALAPGVVVLIEVPEPWPKPAGKHESMIDLVIAAQEHPEQVRLLAAVPHTPDAPRAVAFRPTPTGMLRSEHTLGDDPIGALRSVLHRENGAHVLTTDGVTTMLVCTQGSHDVCCGTDGVVFAEWAEAEAGVEVFRVSHTGGHRFSPTAMTLPDGRMWAYLNADSARQIASTRDSGASVAAQCRGWWGAPTGPAQVGERAVFAELGFVADELTRSVEVTPTDAGHQVVVTAGDRVFDLTVSVGREVPTIACGAPGGMPAKPGREWIISAGPIQR